MFGFLLKKAATASNLYNIRCSIDRFLRNFPKSPATAAANVFSLIEDLAVARDCGTSPDYIMKAVFDRTENVDKSAADCMRFTYLVFMAKTLGKEEEAKAFDVLLNKAFYEGTGTELEGWVPENIKKQLRS